MIKENKKNSVGFGNLLDVILIVVVISILLCSYVKLIQNRFYTKDANEFPSVITLTVMLPEVKDENSLKTGDKLHFESTNEYFGTVKSVNAIYKSNYKVNQNTRIARRIFTDEVAGLLISLDIPVKDTEKGYFVNDSIYIAHGSRVSLYKNKNETFEADVYSINVDKDK